MEKTVYCPVNGWDCPYWRKGGVCVIDNPKEDCDDYAAFWNGWDDEDEDDNEDQQKR